MALQADLRDAGQVLKQAAALLDFSQPVAVLFVASLHHVADEDDPAAVVARYLDGAVPGSYLVISHCTDDIAPEAMRAGFAAARQRGVTFVPRSHADILRLFAGHDLLDPGLVQVPYWRPDGEPELTADQVFAYGAIARI